MTDTHLTNTIIMLERVAKQQRDSELKAAWAVLPYLHGEMATFFCDQDIDSMEEDEEGLMFLHPLYEELVYERTRRELSKLNNKSNL